MLASRACLDHKPLLIVAVLTDDLNYLHIRIGGVIYFSALARM